MNVIDEDGTTLEKYGLAGFMGRVGSKINYCLTPDKGATDENGGLVEVSDLLGDGGEDIFRGQAGCTGRWNSTAKQSTARRGSDAAASVIRATIGRAGAAKFSIGMRA